MSLAGSGKADHPVARRGMEFLLNSAQEDGSWKIDTNLSTFVTTLSTHALAFEKSKNFSEQDRAMILEWLLQQQYRTRHPYTNAAPGGWAWTPLPGGVPDADDTAGALLALKTLNLPGPTVRDSAMLGMNWLLNLQNSDGGIPTFCRGWGKLPFDRSSADITAHALRAWAAWEKELPEKIQPRIAAAKLRAVAFLRRVQEQSGSWTPLWFGNQLEPDESNRVYGTSRVVLALSATGSSLECLEKGVGWLVRVQCPEGGWSGGGGSTISSIEETALALEALCAAQQFRIDLTSQLQVPIRRGLTMLLDRVADGRWTQPAPIGFYFAKLWYYEKLYTIIFTVAALERAGRGIPGVR